MIDKNTRYGLPEADQLIQCSSCKDHVEICDSISFKGQEYCDSCSGIADVENDLSLAEDIRDSQREQSYIRKHLEGEFEPDFSEEYGDA